MTHAELAVEVLKRAISADTTVDPAFKAALEPSQEKFLRQSIIDFCQYVIDSGCNVGMPAKFHTAFRDLCEAAGFDADEYGNEGFDREDV